MPSVIHPRPGWGPIRSIFLLVYDQSFWWDMHPLGSPAAILAAFQGRTSLSWSRVTLNVPLHHSDVFAFGSGSLGYFFFFLSLSLQATSAVCGHYRGRHLHAGEWKDEACHPRTIRFLCGVPQRPLQAPASQQPFKSRVKSQVHPPVMLLPGVGGVCWSGQESLQIWRNSWGLKVGRLPLPNKASRAELKWLINNILGELLSLLSLSISLL